MSDYFSTQGWVYIAVSIILTIISLALNVYLEGPGLYLIAYFVYLFVILLTAYNITLSLIHISEPTRLGMISYAVFCLKKNSLKQIQMVQLI